MDIYKINESAGLLAGCMVDVQREQYGIPIIDETLTNTNILSSPCGTAMVRGYVLGAIREYHRQLWSTLISQGIDIGPFSPEDDE